MSGRGRPKRSAKRPAGLQDPGPPPTKKRTVMVQQKVDQGAWWAEPQDMATAASSALECPVCHEGFSEPKILPCAHLVCRKCVLEWLEKGGDESGCPLCRAPILPDSVKGQGDLASQVDTLPTDLAIAVVVESEKTLSGDHVCSCSEEATLFCLQCAIKICISCAKTHAKIPATRDHVTEKLSDLSAEQLAMHQHTPCVKHSNKQAEVYCSDHEELVCVLCASSAHHQCSEVKLIEEAATGKREELRVLVQRLVDREATATAKVSQLSTEMTDAQAEFKAMRDKVTATFDDMQTVLEARRQKLLAEIRGREDGYLAERKSSVLELKNLQTALSANRSTGERLVSSAADSTLLGMLGKLKARLEALESQALPDPPRSTPGTLLLRAATVEKTKKAVAAIGALKDTENEHIHETMGDMKFRISPSAFFQVNTAAAEVLYKHIADWCNVSPTTTILDICCGTGTIGQSMAKNVARVVGIEMCKEAIEDAQSNASLNGVTNVTYHCAKVEHVISDIIRNVGSDPVAVLDPPRGGMHPSVIKSLRKCHSLNRIVYAACNPAGAKSNFIDLCRPKSRKTRGQPFKFVRAVPLDMFPSTMHFELLVLFERVPEEQNSNSSDSE